MNLQRAATFGLDQPSLDSLDGWTVRQRAFEPEHQHHDETVFTIGNGHHCLRGAFEEGYPDDQPAGFMHRLWDDVPISVSELASLPKWWGVDLWIDGDRFGLQHGRVLDFERSLDLRTGVLRRSVTWEAPSGAVVEITFERFIDFSSPHRAAVRLQLNADHAIELRTRSVLDAHVDNLGLVHFDVVSQSSTPSGATLGVRTRATRHQLGVAAEVALTVDGLRADGQASDADGTPAVEHHLNIEAGQRVEVTSFVALVPDFDEAESDEADPLAAAEREAAEARSLGWDAVRVANDAAWAEAWEACDVEIDGDPRAQLAVRFSLFQLLIAVPRFSDRASIGAKTLSGYGYRHHAFWDTEVFMLPVFTHTLPQLAKNMLSYRWHGLAGARHKAAANGYRGAQFPWESAETGAEVTPVWVPDPADASKQIRVWTGELEVHITADVAWAVLQYWRLSADEDFLLSQGAELVLDGASFWASAAQREDDAHFHFRDVVGPDEYHDHVDDNAFTNQVAAWHLRSARALADWLAEAHPQRWAELAEALGLDADWLATWDEVAAGIVQSADPETGLIEQFSGYFDLTDVPVAALRDPTRQLSMQAILGVDGVAETQILKQPDVLMLAHLLPQAFSDQALAANYAYYDPRTDHEFGSSLGPAISAIIASRVGDVPAAYQHFERAALADLLDVRGNAGDGIHGASLGGVWQAVVFGFAGLQIDEDGWTTQPRLPSHWQRLAFTVTIRGQRHRIEIASG